MTRKDLTREIDRLDHQLTVQEDFLQDCKAKSVASLRQTDPLLLAGLGVAAGLVIGHQGVTSVFGVARIGFNAQRLLGPAFEHLMNRIEL